MTEERKNWIVHEPSTYSYLGRNDSCVNWLLTLREQQGFYPPKKIVIIGSGVIEPFTIAALPLALQSEIIAIENNQELINQAELIKQGRAILWLDIAKRTQHPGVVNTQLIDPIELNVGISKLALLGSLLNLGSGFNNNFFQVKPLVAERVTYIPQDALSVLKSLSDIDMICDFFVQVNINKDKEKGVDYTRQMVKAAVAALSLEGKYIIGDSGRNMPITLNHINNEPDVKLNVSVLVHAINQRGKYSSSYYSVLGKRNIDSLAIEQRMQKNIGNIARKFKLPIREQVVSIDELVQLNKKYVYLGFIENGNARKGIVWYCPLSQKDTLVELASSEDKPFVDEIIFPK